MSLYGTACSCHECADHSGHDPFIDDLPTDVGPDVKPTSDKSPMILWIEALRSGTYKQGQHRLRRGDEFCCLGVASDLYERHVGDITVKDEVYYGPDRADYSYDGEYFSWPKKVKDWMLAGLDYDPHGADDLSGELMIRNDNGESFAMIADYLESKLLRDAVDTSLPCFDLGDMD